MLPTATTLRLAIERYLDRAYGADPPAAVTRKYLPPADADVAQWLTGRAVECQPAHVSPTKMQSFALRVGNRRYPFMKIRLTRPARKRYFVFSVDAHDACLHAPGGSHDALELEKLKRFNTQLAQEIMAVWDAAGIITEREYLRRVIRQTRKRKGDGASGKGG